MSRPLFELLQTDHAHIDRLLSQAAAGETIDPTSYEPFRGALLRHIGLEEKILLPTARRLRGGEQLPIARQLKADHAAMAALLVPTPTRAIVDDLQALLAAHNPLEEDAGGLYEICEELAAAELDELLRRLKEAPAVPMASHYDGPRAFEGIDRLLRAAGRRP